MEMAKAGSEDRREKQIERMMELTERDRKYALEAEKLRLEEAKFMHQRDIQGAEFAHKVGQDMMERFNVT